LKQQKKLKTKLIISLKKRQWLTIDKESIA
jgi:hypothetical protein